MGNLPTDSRENLTVAQVLIAARNALSEEFGIDVSYRMLGDAAGISHEIYRQYEKGRALSDRSFRGLCEALAHRPDLVHDLRSAYGRAKREAKESREHEDKKRVGPESILLFAADAGLVDLKYQTDDWTHEIRTSSNNGEIAAAYKLARAVWPIAKKEALAFPETQEMALQVARAYSQASEHEMALQVLKDWLEPNRGVKIEAPVLCEFELSKVAITNRRYAFRGVIAAEMYANVANMISVRAGKQPSGKWRELWSNLSRSRIQALTDPLGSEGLEYAEFLAREFRYWLERPEGDYEDRANKLVISRLDAVRSRFDESFEVLELLGVSASRPAERALIARTKAINLFRAGRRDQALDLVDESIRQSIRGSYKEQVFRLLRNEMQLRMNAEPLAKKP